LDFCIFLATNETSQKFQIVEYMISISSKGICGEDDVRVLRKKEAIISGMDGWDSLAGC